MRLKIQCDRKLKNFTKFFKLNKALMLPKHVTVPDDVVRQPYSCICRGTARAATTCMHACGTVRGVVQQSACSLWTVTHTRTDTS